MAELLADPALAANPASSHGYGRRAAALIQAARVQIASCLGGEPTEILFTSGATEANNLALLGVMRAHRDRGNHLITTAIEHPSVLAPARQLEAEGFKVTYLPVHPNGQVDLAALTAAIGSETLLISVMAVNNETGVMQPLEAVAAMAAEAGLLLHVDGSQAVGKLPLDLQQLPIDLLSLSAHKFYGPKGVGALYIRDRAHLRLQPLLYGGGQEWGLRSGTLATHQIVGLAEALQWGYARQPEERAQVEAVKAALLAALAPFPAIQIHGDPQLSSPYILNLSIAGWDADAVLNQLDEDAALSSGSACQSGTLEPSAVLRAMGVRDRRLYGAIRLSLSYTTHLEELQPVLNRLIELAQNPPRQESQ